MIFRRLPASSSFVLAAARLRALQPDPWPRGEKTRHLRGRIQKNNQPSPTARVVTGPGPYALLTLVALMGAAYRVSGPPCAGTSVRRCMPQGFVILTAKPVRRSRRKGPAAGTWPGRSRCRRRPGPGSGRETGADPGLSACPAPGRRPCPRTPRQSPPPRPRPPRRGSKRLPDTSVSLPGIMLSDEGGQGERARSRRSARSGGRLLGRLAAAAQDPRSRAGAGRGSRA